MLAALLAPGIGLAQAPGPEVYTVDIAHSILDFTVRLAGFNRTRGSFKDWDADFVYDPATPSRSSISFVASVGSITTSNDDRDRDLKGEAFFDVAHYPRMRFVSDEITGTEGGLLVRGRLTIKDVTRPIQFPVKMLAPLGRDPFDNLRISFGASLALNRRDFNVIGPKFWNNAISDSVRIEMEIAGRIWNYASIGLGSPERQAIGRLLLAAADSGRLGAAITAVRSSTKTAAQDSAHRFGPGQFVIAAMLLAQRSPARLREAHQILEAGLELATFPTDADRAAVLTRLGEISYRQGDRAKAREELQRALALAPEDTNAAEWRRLLEVTQ